MTLPLDGYVRVSRVGGREGDGFISPHVQERAIREFAERGGVEVIIRPHELNVSGGTMDRPVFNTIMERVRRGESGGILVYKTDRFARTLLGALSTLAELGKHNASFASASEPTLDYSTPAGRAFLHMMFVFSEFVRSTLKEAWATAARNAVVERGIHMAPYGAFGYDKDPTTKRLIPNAEAKHAVEAFRRRADDSASWVAIADWLSEVAPLPGGRHWTGQAVQRMCARRVYLGEAFWSVIQNTEDREPALNRSAHPALVTEDLWHRAQMRPELARGGTGNGASALLGGLLRCEGCRYTMSLGYARGGYRTYRCRGRYSAGRCPNPVTISAAHVEAYMRACIADELEDSQYTGVADDTKFAAAQAELVEARSQLEDFRLDRAARKRLGTRWNEWLDGYLTEVEDAERKVTALASRRQPFVAGLTSERFFSLPNDRQRGVIAASVDAVVVRRSMGRGRNVDPVSGRLHIFWKGRLPSDFPRPRVHGGTIRSFDWPEHEVEARVLAPEVGG